MVLDSKIRQIDRRRFLRLSALGGVALAGCTGNNQNQNTETNQNSGGNQGGDSTLRMPLQNDPETLEPAHGENADELFVMHEVFDSLLIYNGKMEIQPNLAKSLPETPDDKTYIFELRDGLTFHNGDSVTAEDVVYSYNWVLENETTKAANYSDIKSVKANDDRTVQINLSKPFAPFLDFVASAGRSIKIVNKKLREKKGETSTTLSSDPSGAGTGPFKFVEWNSGNNIILERNQNYHIDGIPKVDRLELPIQTEGSTQITNFKSDKLDILYKIPLKDFSNLSDTGNYGSKTTDSLEIEHIYMNLEKEPFNNKDLRLAFSHAVDREEVLKKVFYNKGVPCEGPWLPGDKFHNPKVADIISYDPKKAKKHLEKAGKPNGFSFTLGVTNSSWFPDQARLIQNQLSEVGIEMKIELLDKASNYGKIFDGKFEAALEDTVSRIPHPDNMLFRHFHREGSLTGRISRYDNKRVTELIGNARRTADVEKQKDMYFEAQKLITQDQPYVFILYRPAMGLWQQDVSGFDVVPTIMPFVRDVTIGN